MAKAKITKKEGQLFDRCLEDFSQKHEYLEHFLNTLYEYLTKSPSLRPLVHSSKRRIKDTSHVRRKLERKTLAAKETGEIYLKSAAEFFSTVTDLAGIRLLHLHTSQIEEIDQALKDALNVPQYEIIEGPTARVWDSEYRRYFTAIGILPVDEDSMYTSVHYLVASRSDLRFVCEIQVRTLMEEVWGEVSHIINYPNMTKSIACQEQLKVLARATSSCTRLVDSLFKSADEYKQLSEHA